MRREVSGNALPRLVSVQRVAELWSLRPDTVRAWARRGLLPALWIGRKILFSEDDLRDFLQKAARARSGDAGSDEEVPVPRRRPPRRRDLGRKPHGQLGERPL